MAQGSALPRNRDFQCSFATASLTDARTGRSKIRAELNHLKVNFPQSHILYTKCRVLETFLEQTLGVTIT